MSPAAPERAVRPAPIELAALAVAVRPDWHPDVVAGTIQRAVKAIGWPKVLTRLPELMTDPAGTPADLLAVRPDPARIGVSDHPVPASDEFLEAARRLRAKAVPVADDLTTRREANR